MRRCSTFLVSLLVGVTLTLGASSGQNPPSRPDGDPMQALLDEYDRAIDIRTAKRRVDPDRADKAVAWSRDWIERVDRVLESDPDHPKWYMARHLQYELAQKLKQGENPDYATPKRILRDMIRRAEAGGSYNLMAQMDLCSECDQEWDRLWRRGEARPADGDETYDEAVKMQRLLETHWDELVTRIPRNRDHYQELRIAAIRSQAAVLARSRMEYLRAAELYLQVERVIVEHFGDPPPEDSCVEQQREGVLAAAIRCYALGGRKDLALQVLDQQFVTLPRLRMLPLSNYLIDDFRQVLWPERGEPDYQEYLLHCLNTRPVDEDWLDIAAELAYVQSRVQTNDAERELAMRALTRVAEACERHPELTLKRPTVYANACEKLALLHFRRGDWRKAEHYALEYLRIEFEFPERFQSFLRATRRAR